MGTYLRNDLRVRDGIPSQEGLMHVKRTVEAYGGRWLADRPTQAGEGPRTRSVIVVEFENMTDAQSWYDSPEYETVARLYVDNAIDLMLADGISPDFTMTGFAPRSALRLHER